MGVEEVRNFTSTWTTTTTTMAAPKLCDSCKSSTAALFCRADSAFLCVPCDSKVHAANKLASRHARVWMCEVCEQAPAHVTCKADAAALCVTCDRDIHSANPLARRHERFPVTPFYDSATAANHHQHHHQQQYFDDVSKGGNVNETEAEAEAASWLIPNPNSNYGNVYSEMDMDPYLDLVYGSTVDTTKVEGHKLELNQPYKFNNNKSSAADCVVPVQNNNFRDSPVNGGEGGLDSCFDVDLVESKAIHFYNNVQSVGQSVSSSSLDAGVVPDGSTMIDVSNPFGRQYSNVSDATNQKVQVSGIDREARVLRYREKRKNRKFEKTIRYASRKAYAETRPRIKGRFAKRSEIEFDVDQIFGTSPGLIAADTGYGVVPTF